ncbi:hypothetical protein ES708_32792 [subsurface metagenome]
MAAVSGGILLKTRIFDLCNGRYANLSELARAMGVSSTQVYVVRQGARRISDRFIVGAMKAFPGYKLDDLFYIQETGDETPDEPDNGCTDEIVSLLEHHADMTYQKIGNIVGCSRQRVHEVAERTGLTHAGKVGPRKMSNPV